MLRKMSVVLPLLFVFVLAFSLVVTMYSTATADPPEGCCWYYNPCQPGGYWGWGERVSEQPYVCQSTLWSRDHCGLPPGNCQIE
ncbi:MAG: hypothetical protein JSU74_03490 [Candidatus Zixiibacteriota bacterium]|nr:MAG: hypothetical protein JSU74_03490 [candidate division Zixibacteria bacterium]